jgi:predicted nucleotidyltransferase
VETTPEAARLLARVRAVLAAAPSVDLALVFGSVARGTPRADSDLDVAVWGTVDTLALTAALAEEVGRDVHVVRLEQASIPLLEAVIEDGIVVHEKRRGAAASWRSRTLADLELDRPWYARQRDAWLKRVAAQGL